MFLCVLLCVDWMIMPYLRCVSRLRVGACARCIVGVWTAFLLSAVLCSCFWFSSLTIIVFLLRRAVFFFKRRTEYGMRISDWSSDVCSSDLVDGLFAPGFDAAVAAAQAQAQPVAPGREGTGVDVGAEADLRMLRIGGNFPERCDVRHIDAVVGACEDPTVESDFDGLDADAILEGPARDFETRAHAVAGCGHIDPGHRRRRARTGRRLRGQREQQEALRAVVDVDHARRRQRTQPRAP